MDQPINNSEYARRQDPLSCLPQAKLGFGGFWRETCENFRQGGELDFANFREMCNLQPTDHVLDVGCSIGRLAVPFLRFLRDGGRYDGMDTNPVGLYWCQRMITPRYPHFRFHFADIYNKLYNPLGEWKASECTFPYADDSFDFILLASVFTHMRPLDLANYLAEVSRILRPGGRCLITYFLLDEEALRLLGEGKAALPFGRSNLLPHAAGKCRLGDPRVPESIIAFDEDTIVRLYADLGLEVQRPIRYGKWSGRTRTYPLQDQVVAYKSSRLSEVERSRVLADWREELTAMEESIRTVTESEPEPDHAEVVSIFRREVARNVPENVAVLVCTGDEAFLDLGLRTASRFPGPDRDESSEANEGLREAMEAARRRGAEFLVIPPPSFDFLRTNEALRRHLDESYWCITFNQRCIAYQLSDPYAVSEPRTIREASGLLWGHLDQDVTGGRLSGWAWDCARPDTPISVDIFDGKTLLGTVHADRFRQELLDEGRGDGRHGFEYLLPQSLIDGRQHVLTVRIAGFDLPLAKGTVALTGWRGRVGSSGSPGDAHWVSDRVAGFLDSKGVTDSIRGWAYDPLQPETPMPVTIEAGDERIGPMLADMLRPDLAQLGKGTGMHGFRVPIPPSLRDGRAFDVRVRIAGIDLELKQSPQSLSWPMPTKAAEVPWTPSAPHST
jgi:SAM-dependent methyltransferase